MKTYSTEKEAEQAAEAARRRTGDACVFYARNNTDLQHGVYYVAPARRRDALGVLPTPEAGDAYVHVLRYRCDKCGGWQTVHRVGVPDYVDCDC